MPRQYAEWSGVRLAYDNEGQGGSPVLLIMGYTVPGSAWVHQIAPLSKRHRLVWYDHRGCGGTSARPGAYTTALLAEDAARLMDHLGWDSAHVVGVSMGGMVAQELALRDPRRLRSLSLIVSHAGGLAARLPPLRGLKRFLQANLAPRSRRLHHLERMLFPEEYLQRCDRRWLTKVLLNDFGTPIPLAFRLSQLAAVMRHDTRDRLHLLSSMPTLVVKASRDILVSPAACEQLHRLIPGSRLRVFDDAGHGIIRQCHRELNRELLAHFAAVDERMTSD